jgi:hypothetical protein
MAALVEIATQGKSESARVAAAIALLDRGYGKPPQAIDSTIRKANTPLKDLTDEELTEIIRAGQAVREVCPAEDGY